MSALLSAGRSAPPGARASDSGAAYSSVPVLPVRPPGWSMSREVPKSQSIARGLARGGERGRRGARGGHARQARAVVGQEDVPGLEVEVQDRLVVLAAAAW
jgi:hypothetical protein